METRATLEFLSTSEKIDLPISFFDNHVKVCKYICIALTIPTYFERSFNLRFKLMTCTVFLQQFLNIASSPSPIRLNHTSNIHI